MYGQSHAPLKAPRAGELQPQYFGSSLKHAHWYRQARRLQAYLRFAQANRPTADESHEVWGVRSDVPKGLKVDLVIGGNIANFVRMGLQTCCPVALLIWAVLWFVPLCLWFFGTVF